MDRPQSPLPYKGSLLTLQKDILQLLILPYSSARPLCFSFHSSITCLRVHILFWKYVFSTTHIGFHCIWCVVTILHLSSWSDNSHFLPSSFKHYLSDPLTLPSLIHLSHDIINVLLIFRELSHYLVMVTCHTSHTLGTINVWIVWLGAPQLCYSRKSSTLLRSQYQLRTS